MITYKITLISKEQDIDSSIDCKDNAFALDTAEEQGIEFPYFWRDSACSTCASKIITG